MENFNHYISLYREQLEKGDIQKAYVSLVKYVMHLKTHFTEAFSGTYTLGNVSQGYMDYTYFYYFDAYLRERKLRFGIVLNHEKMRFELWLLGQNAEVQKRYWDLLKNTKWNEGRNTMHKYYILNQVLIENPDFNNLDILTQKIEKEVEPATNEIIEYLKNNE